MVDDISMLQSRIKELSLENEHLKKLFAIGNTFRMERNLEKLLPIIMKEISAFLDAERGTLFLMDWEKRQLWTKFAEGIGSDRIYIALKMGIVGSCVLTKKIVNIAYAYDSANFNPEIDALTGYRTESVLSAPVFNRQKKIIGALEFLNKRAGVFTKEDEEKAKLAAENASGFDLKDKNDLKQIGALVTELRAEMACHRVSLFVLDREKGELSSAFAEGIPDWDIHLNLNLGIAGLVALTAEDINIPDVYADSRFDRSVDERTGYKTRCMLCVPMKTQSGEILGVIQVLNKKNGIFTTQDEVQLKSLSSYVSMFLENAVLFDEQIRQFRSMMEVLAASIDAKDALTAGHSERVAQYSVGIAQELGFSEEDQDTLNVASLLHDYGKLGTDDHILKKPGKLTPQEYEHIKEHVVNTRNILSKMIFSRRYKNIPLLASSHHERLDGSGYAGGLSSGEIPFMGKIIAVADVFEALTAKRHYRDPMSTEDAFMILDEGVESKYEGSIVDALKRYYKQRSLHK
ncbi:MAG: GAF domain-containing protein [Desulfobacterales bacterium]|nr:GAF domain-containing protein [Desulfobacterales bacterium]